MGQFEKTVLELSEKAFRGGAVAITNKEIETPFIHSSTSKEIENIIKSMGEIYKKDLAVYYLEESNR